MLLRFWFVSLLTTLFHLVCVKADGTGLIGYGKTLYNPTCSFACRNVLRRQVLACTPTESTQNHGTAHNPVSTPPKCFVQDHTFLKTMALCIDTYCTLSDKPSTDLIEDYWMSHLGTGTLGDYRYVPVLSYQDALSAARKDEENARASGNVTSSSSTSIPKGLKPYKVSSPLAITTGGSGALNKTRMVGPVQWQLQYNYMSDFEINEKGHSTMAMIIAFIAILLPLFLSFIRFVPSITASRSWNKIKATILEPALFGKQHRQPVAGGLVPTRGQSLYIFLISALNLVLLVAPYTIKQPQASFTTKGKQLLSIMGNRAGVMAMGNATALFLFSSRNNFLLYLTDWSYSTYLLLHRWLGYWTVLHTIIHSAMLWSYYVKAGSYSAEILRLYWIWGIVGTVAVCAFIPFSLLTIRQLFYEFFIVSHIALSLLFLIGYYYHIWYVYTYNWGYEIWMFVAAGIWALERLARIVRMAIRGSRTAIVTVVPDADGEYIRIDIDGKALDSGVAYLSFPTLSWRFWESHPFSVCGSVLISQPGSLHRTQSTSGSESSPGSDTVREKGSSKEVAHATVTSGIETQSRTTGSTFFARARGGVTKALTGRASASETRQVRLRVLIDGPYEHSGRIQSQLAQCSNILCIAGGVGITACLPFLRQNGAKETKLLWSSRKSGLVDDLTPTLNALANVKVETLIGQRFDLDNIIKQELEGEDGNTRGVLAIVVSGPPGLADDVRRRVTTIAKDSKQSRMYLLVDEAFSW